MSAIHDRLTRLYGGLSQSCVGSLSSSIHYMWLYHFRALITHVITSVSSYRVWFLTIFSLLHLPLSYIMKSNHFRRVRKIAESDY
jgi:hypothetical protein